MGGTQPERGLPEIIISLWRKHKRPAAQDFLRRSGTFTLNEGLCPYWSRTFLFYGRFAVLNGLGRAKMQASGKTSSAADSFCCCTSSESTSPIKIKLFGTYSNFRFLSIEVSAKGEQVFNLLLARYNVE